MSLYFRNELYSAMCKCMLCMYVWIKYWEINGFKMVALFNYHWPLYIKFLFNFKKYFLYIVCLLIKYYHLCCDDFILFDYCCYFIVFIQCPIISFVICFFWIKFKYKFSDNFFNQCIDFCLKFIFVTYIPLTTKAVDVSKYK